MSENPADIASRGIKVTALKESSLWLHGPEFLSKESAYWLVQPVKCTSQGRLRTESSQTCRIQLIEKVYRKTRSKSGEHY